MVDVRSAAVYSRSGHLLYVRDGSLVAHTFDTSTGRLVGEPQVISDGVQYFAPTAITAFDVTRDGSRFVVVRSLAESDAALADRGVELGNAAEVTAARDPQPC